MAGVIRNDAKRTEAGEASGQASTSSSQAQRIIQAAHENARALLAEAVEQVEAQSAESAERGKVEGMQQAQHMRQEIQGMSQRMWNEVEGEIVRTGMQMAQALLQHEINSYEDAIVNVVTSALKAAQDAREVFLRVHPSHAVALRENKQRLLDALALARQVDIREDRQVSEGGVLIQTESGVIDAQLETQIAEIERLLNAQGAK